MIPLKFTLEVPEWAQSAEVSERWHNRTLKDIIRRALEHHKVHRIKQHFEYSATSRYRYAQRSAKYLRTKIKYRGRAIGKANPVQFAPDSHLNLVKTGKTRREILNGAKITVGGSGATIRGLLTLKVPIAGGSGRAMSMNDHLRMLAKGKRVKFNPSRAAAAEKLEIVRRTVNEIERFSDDEIQEINKFIADEYVAALKKARRLPKKSA